MEQEAGHDAERGETVDDAAGEAFDKTAQLLGLGYPGGPAVSRLAERGRRDRFKLPRPMLNSGDLGAEFSALIWNEVTQGQLADRAMMPSSSGPAGSVIN